MVGGNGSRMMRNMVILTYLGMVKDVIFFEHYYLVIICRIKYKVVICGRTKYIIKSFVIYEQLCCNGCSRNCMARFRRRSRLLQAG